MNNRHRFLRIILYTIQILLFFIIQETPFLVPQILNVKPLLILPIAINIAIFETDIISFVFSIIIGILLDIGSYSIIGPNVITLIILCYIINYLFKFIIKTRFDTAMLVNILSIFVFMNVLFILNFIIKDIDQKLILYINYFLPLILYTIVLSPIYYYIEKLINHLSKDRE